MVISEALMLLRYSMVTIYAATRYSTALQNPAKQLGAMYVCTVGCRARRYGCAQQKSAAPPRLHTDNNSE